MKEIIELLNKQSRERTVFYAIVYLLFVFIICYTLVQIVEALTKIPQYFIH